MRSDSACPSGASDEGRSARRRDQDLESSERLLGPREEAVCRRTLAIIPALDEAGSIGSVIADLRFWPLAGIRVIDNGSTDGTAEVAASAGAAVIREARRGYGAACQAGLRDLSGDIEWILFCDADGCDDLRQLLPFFQAAARCRDLVLGNRNAKPESRRALTPVQRFGNALAGRLIQLGWGVRFHDLGPLRLVRRSALASMQMSDPNFGWTVEMQAKAAAMGLATAEIPVSYFPRRQGISKIAGTVSGSVRAGAVILFTLARLKISGWSPTT